MADNIWDLSKPRITVHPDEALADLRAYAKTIPGQKTTATGYNKWTQRQYSQDTIRRLFGSWAKACELAGVDYQKTHKYSVDDLLSHIEKVAEWRKARPSIDDLKKYNKLNGTTITHDAYSRRWGSYKNFITLFARYKMGQISKEQLNGEVRGRNKRTPISARLRAEVFQRDGWKCTDCGVSAKDGAKLHVHHMVPASAGGTNEISNLTTNCSECNLGKSDQIQRHLTE